MSSVSIWLGAGMTAKGTHTPKNSSPVQRHQELTGCPLLWDWTCPAPRQALVWLRRAGQEDKIGGKRPARAEGAGP